MRIEKLYETIINLSAVEQFSDIDKTILEKLRQLYEGKCRENSLIISIKKIVRRSFVEQAKNRTDGSGDVNVQYQAEAIIYNVNDILANCEILAIDRRHEITCKYDEHSLVSIKGNSRLKSLKVGQKLAVIIRNVIYTKEHNKITIKAIPYENHTNKKFIVYHLTEKYEHGENAIVNAKMEEVLAEKSEFDKTDSKIRQFLLSTYYPYKKEAALPKEIETINMTKLTNLKKDSILFRPHILDKSSSLICIGDPSQFENYTTIYEKPVRALLLLLDDYLNYIRFIKNMALEFNTEKKLENHNNIWNIYQSIKLSDSSKLPDSAKAPKSE